MMFDLPPPQFDHDFDGRVVEQRLSAQQVEEACGRGYVACAIILAPDYCLIATPIVGAGGVSQASYEIFRRHEIGHCNGWGRDHAR